MPANPTTPYQIPIPGYLSDLTSSKLRDLILRAVYYLVVKRREVRLGLFLKTDNWRATLHTHNGTGHSALSSYQDRRIRKTLVFYPYWRTLSTDPLEEIVVGVKGYGRRNTAQTLTLPLTVRGAVAPRTIADGLVTQAFSVFTAVLRYTWPRPTFAAVTERTSMNTPMKVSPEIQHFMRLFLVLVHSYRDVVVPEDTTFAEFKTMTESLFDGGLNSTSLPQYGDAPGCNLCHRDPSQIESAVPWWTWADWADQTRNDEDYTNLVTNLTLSRAHSTMLHNLARMELPDQQWSADICARCYMDTVIHFIGYCPDHAGFFLREQGASLTDPCRACTPQRVDTTVRNYSFKPAWKFYHHKTEPKSPSPGTLFMGMELETSFRRRSNAGSWTSNFPAMMMELVDVHAAPDNFIFGKQDGSIENGVEFVTHPFTFKWAEKNFPFEWVDSLVSKYGAIESSNSCGAHIHVSRKSFTPSHLWKFVALHTEMTTLLGIYGRRGANHSYGNLTDTYFAQMKDKGRKLAYVRGGADQVAMDFGLNLGRTGLNLSPQDTMELRYPAGATSSTLVKTNIELAQALFDFTKEVSIKHINDGVLQDSGYLLGWIEQNQERFPNLFHLQEKSFPVAKKLP